MAGAHIQQAWGDPTIHRSTYPAATVPTKGRHIHIDQYQGAPCPKISVSDYLQPEGSDGRRWNMDEKLG